MICSLISRFEAVDDFEITVIGPKADWPDNMLRHAREKNIYLGFKPPEEAASYLASADALLVVMSFEQEYELFMRTSFTTKFLDYVAYGKPVILWGPEYCTPSRVVKEYGGALCVTQNKPEMVVSACQNLSTDNEMYAEFSKGAQHLHDTLFNPERLQEIFVSEITKLAKR